MAKHQIRQNGIIYIIPNDELYQKYLNHEAFIDKYGRLMNIKPHRVLKELEQIADDRPAVVVQPKEDSFIRDAFKNKLISLADRGIDKLVYDGLPYLWHKKIKPSIEGFKEYKRNGGKTKAEILLEKSQAQESVSSTQLSSKPKTEQSAKKAMTEEEILDEKRKAVLHYIGLLESLTKLHNAGVIDKNDALEQLTNPAAIEQFNQALSRNPNLLEMTQHLELTSLLGRDLFQGGKYVPIEAKEIKILATNSKQEDI